MDYLGESKGSISFAGPPQNLPKHQVEEVSLDLSEAALEGVVCKLLDLQKAGVPFALRPTKAFLSFLWDAQGEEYVDAFARSMRRARWMFIDLSRMPRRPAVRCRHGSMRARRRALMKG